MKIVRIFAERLNAFHYESEEFDEVRRLFSQWMDPEFLEEFFTQNEDDLQSGFFGSITKEDAIAITRNEAMRLENELKALSENADESLDEIFQPLDNSNPKGFGFSNTKAKGDRPKSWLRIYALKIDDNVYVITGGAIKLTRTMLEREHTRKELKKLERCQHFLKEQGVFDIEGFQEIVI